MARPEVVSVIPRGAARGGQRVLVVTGWKDGNGYSVLENLALIDGQWRKMAISEVCVHAGSAVSFQGELVIVGMSETPDWSHFFEPDKGSWPSNCHYTGVAFNVKKNCWRRLEWPLYDYKYVVAATSNENGIVMLSGKKYEPYGATEDEKFKLRYHEHDGDEWLELPMPPHELGMREISYACPMGLCCIGDVLYLAGGMVDEDPWPASAMLQALDLKTLEWTACPPMPEPRCECLTVAIDGKLFVLGGYPEYKYERYGDDALRSVHSFRPADRQLESRARHTRSTDGPDTWWILRTKQGGRTRPLSLRLRHRGVPTFGTHEGALGRAPAATGD